MYRVILCLLIFFCLLSCNAVKKSEPQQKPVATDNDTVVIKNEELEYEIIIIEPGFNNWLVTQRPRSYFSNSFLETKNLRYVVEWNLRVLQPTRYDTNLYEMQIDYQAHIDYGLEVNYLLYMYFTYFQQQYNQKL